MNLVERDVHCLLLTISAWVHVQYVFLRVLFHVLLKTSKLAHFDCEDIILPVA